jgi:hypothetical protein
MARHERARREWVGRMAIFLTEGDVRPCAMVSLAILVMLDRFYVMEMCYVEFCVEECVG